MIYPLACRLIIALHMARRGRVFETHSKLMDGIKHIRRHNACKLCARCRLLWFLAAALDRKDPYSIVEVYSLLTDELNYGGLSSDVIGHVLEAKQWLEENKNAEDAKDRLPDTATNIIKLWRAQSLDYSNYEHIKNISSRLIWPLEIIKGSMCERAGDVDAALQSYRNALAVMPNWIPEAKVTFEKISELRKT